MAELPPIDARPVLIAGPTASGKSELALRIAERHGGVIVNADAIQVYDNWQVLTARPGADDLARAPHALYGHVAWDAAYSVGHWLREVATLLGGGERVIIVGGTGLYLGALTEGLADIPPTPPEIRAEASAILQGEDPQRGLGRLIAALDRRTRDRIDLQNPMRVQRAWEVLRATGRGLADWQDATPPPVLPPAEAQRFVFHAPKDWLNPRIARRFDTMLDQGALEEARANLPRWDPARPSMKAIGAPQLVAHLEGRLTLEEARDQAIVATRQFAKRQRNWFRARMADWQRIACDG